MVEQVCISLDKSNNDILCSNKHFPSYSNFPLNKIKFYCREEIIDGIRITLSENKALYFVHQKERKGSVCQEEK